jgi:hypothetical protein
MSETNGRRSGRPPHKNSKTAPNQAGDELAQWSRIQLVRMDEKFCQRMERAIKRGLEQPPVRPIASPFFAERRRVDEVERRVPAA